MPRRRRLLGAAPREIPADLLRHLPLRAALATAVRGRRHAGHADPVGRPAHVELAAAGDFGHRLFRSPPPDFPANLPPPPSRACSWPRCLARPAVPLSRAPPL